MTKRNGFTLIELLVAITVLAIVAVLGWRGLDSIVRARQALNADLDQTRGMQLAFAQMQSDLGSIADPKNIGGRSVLSSQAGRITVVRSVFAENQPSRVQVVAYRIRDGVLIRKESIPTRSLVELDAAWRAILADTDTAPIVRLTSDVAAMPIRVYIPNSGWRQAEENASTIAGSAQPNASLPPAMQEQLAQVAATNQPVGLEVTLQLRERSAGLVKVFLLGTSV
ncbi:prepilin-type N-terminal cleavage/methylation domain-containing protein [Noviherbaspirillum sp. Root189]|uniref:prepilin-type N-terminal cleavage/methylation domain-containing protein n=1 Tax=Noviherbaspirillum sp. Root189 TaxID=1736487 RepID=UPI00070B03C1|nr:prepilin-type N-terminal cleavage/methylation domain-containing protein [Noviherbaspirillum sp. Root189]KRB87881.1 type II secretory pathway component PulJ [Noviherbaspirillum sp. Root189]